MRDLPYTIDDLGFTHQLSGEETPAFSDGFSLGPSASLGVGEITGQTTVQDGYLQSSNFVSGSAGWQLTPTSAELNVSTAVNSLDIPDTSTANSFHVESDGDTFWGATPASFTSSNDNALAYVLKTGIAKFQNVTIAGGQITGTPITAIPNSTATDISLLEATHDLVFSVTDKDTVAWATGTITLSNGRTFSITSGNTGNMAARTYIYLDTGTSTTVLQTTTTVSTAMGANKKLIAVAQNGTAQAQYTVYGGIGGIKLPTTATPLAVNNWAYSGTWSVTDADTVAWGSGTLTTSDGGSYSISGSNTGNMAAKTYIYFDLGTSSTAFQTTTTAATAIGDGKILIAIAQNGTGEANYMVMNDKQANIDAANIVAGSITANEIAANAVTATKISVSSLSAIAADMGTLTTGIINLSSGTAYIKSGQSAYDSGTGFWLEYNSGTPRFSIGNSTGSKMTWDGSALDVVGVSQVSKYFTAGEALTAGDAVFVATGTEVELAGPVNADGGSAYSITTTTEWHAQTFTAKAAATGNIQATDVNVYLQIDSGTTGTVRISIRATSGGQPTGADLAFVDVSLPSVNVGVITSSYGGTLSAPVTLTAGTVYAIVIRATSLGGAGVYYVHRRTGDSDYTGGTGYSSINSGSSWSGISKDVSAHVRMTFATAGRVYKTSTKTNERDGGANDDLYGSFIGFVKTSASLAASTPVIISGEATGLTSITRGANYYLSDTFGGVASTPGTNTRKVGIGLTTTSVLITNIW